MDRKLVVVADDFTGSNDTGVQFSKVGLTTNVITEPNNLQQDLSNSDVLVVDLESRFDSPESAFQKCLKLGEMLKSENVTVYKKLDSTFRGNIGAEIEGLMKGLGVEKAVMAAALPSNGRVTINGKVYVHGVPLSETEFAKDPRTPIRSSSIQEILAEQTSLKVKGMPEDWQERQAESQAAFLKEAITSDVNILVFDGQSEADLLAVANVMQGYEGNLLIIGTAGLANHLPNAWELTKAKKTFVFAGSVSEQTRKQVVYAEAEMDLKRFNLSGLEILTNPDLFLDKVKEDVKNAWADGASRFVFTTTRSRDEVDQVFDLAAEMGISRDEAAEKISVWIGKLSATCILEYQPTGIFLTGGDTAIKTVKALGGSGIRIQQEVLPGIPSGILTGCEVAGTVVTKAGGFGEEEAICRVIEFLEA